MKNTKKRSINCILLVLILFVFSTVYSISGYATDYLFGDVNQNGAVGSDDARTILRVSVELDHVSGMTNSKVPKYQSGIPSQAQLADIDQDGEITSADARTALRMSVCLDPLKSIEVSSEKPMTTEEKLQKFIDDNPNEFSFDEGKVYAENNKIVCEMEMDVPDSMILLVKTFAKSELDKMGTPENMEDSLKKLRTEVGDNSVCLVIRLVTTSGKLIFEKIYK